MGKFEPIDGKQTKWEGLWWHPENNGFYSKAISLADLRKFKGNVRLYVRKNKYYNNGENGRPNYIFTLRDANSNTFKLLEIEEYEDADEYTDKYGNRLYTNDEVMRIIHGMEIDYGLEYGNNLISDYV